MKQSEKSKRSRDYILQHAFAEFAAHGYSGSSLNQICSGGNISKGLLYHYYANKDELYLSCIALLFHDMAQYIQSHINADDVTVTQYFAVRMQFFQQYPTHQQLFYDVLIYPQSHLAQRITELRSAFDALNTDLLRTIFQHEKLSEHISLENAIQQFRLFVNFLGVYLREGSPADAEQKSHELLNTMLYGLLAQ